MNTERIKALLSQIESTDLIQCQISFAPYADGKSGIYTKMELHPDIVTHNISNTPNNIVLEYMPYDEQGIMYGIVVTEKMLDEATIDWSFITVKREDGSTITFGLYSITNQEVLEYL